MKTLFLVRHAKSDSSIPGLGDFDRPLNQRGYVDAHKMGTRLGKISAGKTIIISSTAIRAISTAIIISKEINYPASRILLQPDLYEAEPERYEEVIQSIENNYDTAFVFGHNPTISIVISNLSSTEYKDVPTCAISKIVINSSDWTRAFTIKGNLENQLFPKTLLA